MTRLYVVLAVGWSWIYVAMPGVFVPQVYAFLLPSRTRAQSPTTLISLQSLD